MTDHVSRETPPPGAVGVFASRLPIAEQFHQLLATDGVTRGLIGPREVPRLWSRHLVNCAAPLPRVPEGARVADVGSGAGLPGMVWAIARPDLHVTLIEPLLRRTTFLEEATEKLGLDNVTVERARAEQAAGAYDVVTARAVANLDKLARWCMPLVRRPGGSFLAFKGRTAQDEVDAAEATLRRLGGATIVVSTYGDPEDPTTLVEVTT